ncbi:hypothetical protein TELCIR_09517 [Teladorsagia circumcincta]|uniref:Uncharacterized protein n=1 Tax=Teladorsagia circumcincta TaxID=45464 RepID=A0A2G9UET8_TELCI|nr:hypothetical protein TELCIR_09517 [Teladorsagia circumcincta]
MSSSSGSPEPQCRCELHGAVYDFCYHLPPVPEIQGRKFNCVHAQYLEELGLLSTEAALDPKRDEFPEPAFVTATSDNHFKEALTLLANIRKLWPQKKIIVYNIGLNPKTIQALKAKCLVEVRDFPFSFYPPYVKQLDQYRWKPLLIAMMVKEFGAVWYMDTSIRWKTDRLNQVYDEIRCRKDHAWSEYVLCALEKYCMEPPEAKLACGFKDPFRDYAGCHR